MGTFILHLHFKILRLLYFSFIDLDDLKTVEGDENLFIKENWTLVGWANLGDTSDTGIAQYIRFSVVSYTDFKGILHCSISVKSLDNNSNLRNVLGIAFWMYPIKSEKVTEWVAISDALLNHKNWWTDRNY